MAQLLSPDLTRNNYRQVLIHLEAFHSGFEPAIAQALEGHPAALMLDGTRASSLREDLAWLGVAPLDASAVWLASGLRVLTSQAAAMGALYVVEGSGLGGRVIARHLIQSLGVSPGAGGSFYGGTSAITARARWELLCGHLTAKLSEPAPGMPPEAAMITGAVATFQCLERWMRQIDFTVSDPLPDRASPAVIAAAEIVPAIISVSERTLPC
jgi:heme oxygenase